MLKRIIIADDDFDDRQVFQSVIAQSGFDTVVTIAKDGKELMQELEKLKTRQYLPEIIFLDLNMPYKDGFDCLKEIRKDSKLKDMVVVMLSTSSNPEDIKKSYELGASLYVTKPTSFQKIEKMVRAVLTKSWSKNTSKPEQHDFILNL